MKSNIDISPLLLQDDKSRIEEILEFINTSGLKIRKLQTERFMMTSVLYVKNNGAWDIHLYNYTRYRQIAFAYLYLALTSILRREKIWFKTINPINLDKINKRILVDYFTDKVNINGAENFRQEYMQGFYIGFELYSLLKNNKITATEALALFYDCDHLPEQSGICAALKRNNNLEQAKIIYDHFWNIKKPEFIKTVERIDECIEKNEITEKDFFYLQKVHFPEVRKIDFDLKYDIFMNENDKLEYDLTISFAGEDRIVAKDIAEGMSKRGYRVFYDEFEKSKMWGKDLYEYLTKVYQTKAKYCLMIISENYIKKAWTKLERKSAQSRAFLDDNEYILPLKLDNTEVPGMLPTTAYIDFRKETFEDILMYLTEKINNYGS